MHNWRDLQKEKRTPAQIAASDKAAAAEISISDDLWRRISEVIPPQSPGRGRPRGDIRLVVCSIICKHLLEAKWKHLPSWCISGSTAHRWYQRWTKDGTWEAIADILASEGVSFTSDQEAA